MDTLTLKTKLQKLGFPTMPNSTYDQATYWIVWDFQLGYTFSDLLVDGYAGPQTWAALDNSVAKNVAGTGDASPNFSYREFKSKGDGGIVVNRTLLRGLEKYRTAVKTSVYIVSGYRDIIRNQEVGGAKNSQHLYGNAADIEGKLTVPQVKALNVFSGIGYNQSSGLVVHVDVRHVGPNTTNSSVANPATWVYQR